MKISNILSSVKKNYGGLHRSVYILFFATAINRIGGFVFAFLTLFLKTKLDMSNSQIASFVIFTGVITMIGPLIGGTLADARGRKKILIATSFIGASIFALCGIVVNYRMDLVPYMIIGASFFFSMSGPIHRAMLADIVTDEEERKRAFALIYLGINLGVAIGPLIGGFLLANHVALFFIGDAITTMIGLVLILIFVEETRLSKADMEEVDGKESYEGGFVLFAFLKRPILVAFTLIGILSAAVYSQSNFGLSLHLNEFFGNLNGPRYFGLLISSNALIVIFGTIGITELLSKKKPLTNMFIGSILYAIGFGMIGLLNHVFPLYFLSVLFWTFGEILVMTNFNVFMMSHTPVNYRGSFSAMTGIIMGAGHFVSPKLMSFGIEKYGYNSSWFAVGIVALVSAILLYFLGQFDKNRTENIEV